MQCNKQVPQDLGAGLILDKEKLRWSLTSIQLDEMYSFVDNNKAKQWIFLAYLADSRLVFASQVDKRNLTTLIKLWQQIPIYLRKHLDFDTDRYKAYATLIPVNQNFADKTYTQAIQAFEKRIRSSLIRLVRRAR